MRPNSLRVSPLFCCFTYLAYVPQVMKEPMRSEALGRASFKYREFAYHDGKEMPPGEGAPIACSGSSAACDVCVLSYLLQLTHT